MAGPNSSTLTAAALRSYHKARYLKARRRHIRDRLNALYRADWPYLARQAIQASGLFAARSMQRHDVEEDALLALGRDFPRQVAATPMSVCVLFYNPIYISARPHKFSMN